MRQEVMVGLQMCLSKKLREVFILLMIELS